MADSADHSVDNGGDNVVTSRRASQRVLEGVIKVPKRHQITESEGEKPKRIKIVSTTVVKPPVFNKGKTTPKTGEKAVTNTKGARSAGAPKSVVPGGVKTKTIIRMVKRPKPKNSKEAAEKDDRKNKKGGPGEGEGGATIDHNNPVGQPVAKKNSKVMDATPIETLSPTEPEPTKSSEIPSSPEPIKPSETPASFETGAENLISTPLEKEVTVADILSLTPPRTDRSTPQIALLFNGKKIPIDEGNIGLAIRSKAEKYGIPEPSLVPVDVASALLNLVENQIALNDKQEEILRILKEEKFPRQSGPPEAGEEKEEEEFPGLPLENLQQLDEFETKLSKSRKLRRSLEGMLKLAGGKDQRITISKMLKSLLSANLRMQFTAQYPREGKHIFKGRKTCNWIIRAMKSKYGKEVKDIPQLFSWIGNVLTNSAPPAVKQQKMLVKGIRRLAEAAYLKALDGKVENDSAAQAAAAAAVSAEVAKRGKQSSRNLLGEGTSKQNLDDESEDDFDEEMEEDDDDEDEEDYELVEEEVEVTDND